MLLFTKCMETRGKQKKFQENITSPEPTYTEGPGKLIFKLQLNTGFYYFSGLLFYLRSSCRLAISKSQLLAA